MDVEANAGWTMKNFGAGIVMLMSVECAAVSIVFAYNRSFKLALYWLAVAVINAIASTF